MTLDEITATVLTAQKAHALSAALAGDDEPEMRSQHARAALALNMAAVILSSCITTTDTTIRALINYYRDQPDALYSDLIKPNP